MLKIRELGFMFSLDVSRMMFILSIVCAQHVHMHYMWYMIHRSDESLLELVFLDNVLLHLFRNHCMNAISLCLIAVFSSIQQVSIFGKTNCKRKRKLTRFRNSCIRIFREHFFANTSTGGNFSRTHLTRVFEKVSILCIFLKKSFSRKIHIEIISKTVVTCICEIYSSLVIFFFENTTMFKFFKNAQS